jgi:DNA-binding response OmpR family regulator
MHPGVSRLTTSIRSSDLAVLIVEDDEVTRSRLEVLIESAGHGALSVSTAAEAREALSAVFFPIVIVDRFLEQSDGLDLCRELRSIRAHDRMYIIMLSARDSQEDVAAALRAGADEYISKRMADQELPERLRKVLAAHAVGDGRR